MSKKCPNCGACPECGSRPPYNVRPYPRTPWYPSTPPYWWSNGATYTSQSSGISSSGPSPNQASC